MCDSPAKSIQSACKGWAETIAAYRLLNNKHLKSEAILAPHRQALIQRASEHDCIAVAQDTTELDYTKKKKLQGSGPLNYEKRRGFLAHTQFVITRQHLPLGVLGTHIYARSDDDERPKRKQRPIEEKESYRWLQGYRQCCELAQELPNTRVLSISDREGDIYEIYDSWRQGTIEGKRVADWLVRANQDRALLDENGQAMRGKDRKNIRLFEHAKRSKELGEIQFEVKAAQQSKKVKGQRVYTQRDARSVRQRIRTCTVTPRPPYRKESKLEPISIHVVFAEEIDPPPGQDPITWLLLTSREVKSFEDAVQLLEYYLARWEIEVFHRVLKTGCRVEEIQLRDHQAVLNCVVMNMIVAWRILYLTHLGRECSDLPCSAVFAEAEWKSVMAVKRAAKAKRAKNGKDLRKSEPMEEPSLAQMVLYVAEEGGYLGRTRDGPPGAQAMWQGMERVRIFATAWEAFGDHGDK